MKTTAELAEIFNVSEQTILRWADAGMPVAKLGRRGAGNTGQYDLEAVVRWHFETNQQRVELEFQRARLAKEQADKTALDNAERRGELLTVDSVAHGWAGLLTNARAKLLGLPSKLSHRLAAEKKPAACHLLLTDEIHAVLTEMARYEPDTTDSQRLDG